MQQAIYLCIAFVCFIRFHVCPVHHSSAWHFKWCNVRSEKQYFLVAPSTVRPLPILTPPSFSPAGLKGGGKGWADIGFGASVYLAASVLEEYLKRLAPVVGGERVDITRWVTSLASVSHHTHFMQSLPPP